MVAACTTSSCKAALIRRDEKEKIRNEKEKQKLMIQKQKALIDDSRTPVQQAMHLKALHVSLKVFAAEILGAAKDNHLQA